MKNILLKFFSKKSSIFLILLITAVFLFFLGFFLGKKEIKTGKNVSEEGVVVRQGGYQFISPLLECDVNGKNSHILKSDELKMKQAIQEDVVEKNPKINLSIYYRDLKNGPWFGINEENGYSPASLLKVPLLIAYYKHAQVQPDIFSKKVFFNKATPEFFQQVKPEEQVRTGNSYIVSQLIESMIKYSDNDATNLLFQNISQEDLNAVFGDLGINMPDIYNADNIMSVKDYASFFRILYNASYLNRSQSEEALKLLSETKYQDGLVAGVPENMLVSHKFGERESVGENGQTVKQLHDCGIIYHPTRPYLLCVMTRGKNLGELSKVIADISKIVYKQLDSGA